MRLPRIRFIPDESVVHHCTSHLVDPLPFLSDLEKSFFLHRMWKLARFCHMTILDYSIMSNHFHIAVRPPQRLHLSDQALLDKLRSFYGPRSHQARLFSSLLQSRSKALPLWRQRYLRRMGDISVFMKELKEGFSRWYNHQHDRRGTLWQDRFSSTLFEDHPHCLLPLLLYIDLNAVRAGLVQDPLLYPFCGYAAALAGQPEPRAGLRTALPPAPWKLQCQHYRLALFSRAAISGHSDKAALQPELIAKVFRQRGTLTLAQLLRLRVRHFSSGAAFGSPQFVERIWNRFWRHHTRGRKSGPRRLRGKVWRGLCTLRDLRKQAIGLSRTDRATPPSPKHNPPN